jgi:hypothetical protein
MKSKSSIRAKILILLFCVVSSTHLFAQLKDRGIKKNYYSESEIYQLAKEYDVEDHFFENRKLLPRFQSFLKHDKIALKDYLTTILFEFYKTEEETKEIAKDLKKAGSLSDALAIIESPGKYPYFVKNRKSTLEKIRSSILDRKNTWALVVAKKEYNYLYLGFINDIEFLGNEKDMQIINQKEVFAKQPKWQAAYQEYRKTQVADK